MTDAPDRIRIDNEMYEHHWHEGSAPDRGVYPHVHGEYIRADLVPQWMDIETAPKDGTPVLICYPGMANPWVAMWEKMSRVPDRWRSSGLGAVPFTPTHWMPLPAPPAKETP